MDSDLELGGIRGRSFCFDLRPVFLVSGEERATERTEDPQFPEDTVQEVRVTQRLRRVN